MLVALCDIMFWLESPLRFYSSVDPEKPPKSFLLKFLGDSRMLEIAYTISIAEIYILLSICLMNVLMAMLPRENWSATSMNLVLNSFLIFGSIKLYFCFA